MYKIKVLTICLTLLVSACGLAGEEQSTPTQIPLSSAQATLQADTAMPPVKATDLAAQTQVPPVPTLTPSGASIIWGVAPPYSTDIFWSGGSQWNDYNLVVYAGALGSNHTQGLIIVEGPGGGLYPTKEKCGILTITDFAGSVLTLKSDKGSVWKFDVNSTTFTLIDRGNCP